jgi:hypothetical protein
LRWTLSAAECTATEIIIQVVDTQAAKGIQDNAFRFVTTKATALRAGILAAGTGGTVTIENTLPGNVDGYFVGQQITIVDGAGAAQARVITAQVGPVLTVSPAFVTAPAAGSAYEINALGLVPAPTLVQIGQTVDAQLGAYGVATSAQVADVVTQVGTSAATAAAVWDLANGVEPGVTPRGALRLVSAAVAGRRTGIGTTTENYSAVGNAAKNRIQMTFPSTTDPNSVNVITDVTP